MWSKNHHFGSKALKDFVAYLVIVSTVGLNKNRYKLTWYTQTKEPM
jgi:hypothetical protein